MSKACFTEWFWIEWKLDDVYNIAEKVCKNLGFKLITLKKVKEIVSIQNQAWDFSKQIQLWESHTLVPNIDAHSKTKESRILINPNLSQDIISKIKIRTYILAWDEMMLEYCLRNALSEYFKNENLIEHILEMLLVYSDHIIELSEILMIEDEKEYPTLNTDNFKNYISNLVKKGKFDIWKVKEALTTLEKEKDEAMTKIIDLDKQIKDINVLLPTV